MESERFFVVCLDAERGDDLRIGRVYRASEDPAGKRSGYTRVWDDCGEDYLYPANQFLVVSVPESEKQRLEAALTR